MADRHLVTPTNEQNASLGPTDAELVWNRTNNSSEKVSSTETIPFSTLPTNTSIATTQGTFTSAPVKPKPSPRR
jgi:hypothetical protein